MFIVHNELDDGWMWVTNVRTEEQGLIVEDLVEEVVSVLAVKCTPVESNRTILMSKWYLLGARGGSTRGKSVSICSQPRFLSLFVNIETLFLRILSHSWYHGKITKQEAYNLLMTGTFFVS